MLYILTGTDEFSKREVLEEIKKSLGDAASLATSTTYLDGRQLKLDELRASCQTVPFLSSKRLVIIEGLLDRFEESRDHRRTKARSDSGGHESIAAYLKQVPAFTEVLLVDDKIVKNPLFDELSHHARVRTFPPLTYDHLQQWVRRRMGQAGGDVSPQAVNLLVQRVGGNLRVMASEINKLVLFAGKRRIEESDVRDLVADLQESSVFAMVDAILEYRAGPAESMVEQLLERGAAPPYLLTMVLRQAGLIVRARDLKKRGHTQAEIQSRLGLFSFALKKTLEQAQKYPLERLKEVYDRLLEADLSIKTGRSSGELAVTLLVADLAAASPVRQKA